MPLYNTVLTLPSIELPKTNDAVNNFTQFRDERLKIAEVEAAFEEFETELSAKFCQCILPVGTRSPGLTPVLNEFPTPINNPFRRSTISHNYFQSTVFGTNLNQELSELDLSSQTRSGSRFPNGSSRVSVLPQSLLSTAPILQRRSRSSTHQQEYNRTHDLTTQSSNDLQNSSLESPTVGGIAETESSDNFLVDEEEAEATLEEYDGY